MKTTNKQHSSIYALRQKFKQPKMPKVKKSVYSFKDFFSLIFFIASMLCIRCTLIQSQLSQALNRITSNDKELAS